MGCRYGHAEGAAGCAIPVCSWHMGWSPRLDMSRIQDLTQSYHSATIQYLSVLQICCARLSAFGYRGPDSAELVGQLQAMHAMTVGTTWLLP